MTKRATVAAQTHLDLPAAKWLLADRAGGGHTAHQGESHLESVESAIDAGAGVFQVERAGPVLIVTPVMDLRELNYLEIEAAAKDILPLLGKDAMQHVVLDFRNTDYYGSTALGFFIKLWKRVRECDGRMAFCRLSDHEREILEVTHLDGIWPICSSREEAIRTVQR